MSEKIVKYEYEYGLCKRCTTVDYGACVMKVCQGILRKRVWPVPVQWMAVIRIVQLWKVRMPLLIRSGSGICWTIRLKDRKKLRQRQEELHIIP